MIEKFLEKFLPQITERVNENAEVGKALIEALAVLDNYATLNNVELTEEQMNQMLGVIPEPAPEPNADIPAEIVEIVEKKKRGRKPKTTWSWRFKTAQEFEQEYGKDWREQLGWNDSYAMDYLLGQPIKETKKSKEVINNFINSNRGGLDIKQQFSSLAYFGIAEPTLNTDVWVYRFEYFTDKPLPTAATPTWSWRYKTEDEFIRDFGKNWRGSFWTFDNGKDYLFGKPIPENTTTKEMVASKYQRMGDTKDLLGIDSGGRNNWAINIEEEWTQDPLPTAETPTTWNWRFKTEEEFEKEYGADWRVETEWSGLGGMDYLLGEEIAETSNSRDVISLLQKGFNNNRINTFRELGISSGDDDDWILNLNMLINKPLPTAIPAASKSAPKKRGRKPKTAWSWRFKTEEEFKDEYGKDWIDKVYWNEGMNYLFGQPIAETINSQKTVNRILSKVISLIVNTGIELGISSGIDDNWAINNKMITNKPLPTAIPAASKSAPKKRGRKPKTAWSWRFKTEQELEDDLETGDGSSWREKLSFPQNMDYLLGQPIKESVQAKTVIDELVLNPNEYIATFTGEKLGIYSPDGDENYKLNFYMITNLPLPTAAAPAKSEPKKRGRKPKSALPEIDLGGLEDIGDIDIDDIDFDNLVL